MKKSWAMKWVKALRSGKYKQTTKHLRTNQGHCCLGVLCSLTPYKNNYTKMPVKSVKSASESVINGVLPNAVQELVGMRSGDGETPVGILSALNDAGKNFTEIANIIEEHWKNL